MSTYSYVCQTSLSKFVQETDDTISLLQLYLSSIKYAGIKPTLLVPCTKFRLHQGGTMEDNCHIENHNLPCDEVLFDLAELYKVFGDSTRIKILYILLEGEMCVQHISEMLSVTQSAVSHQLRLLKSARLVKFRRDGKTVYYSLSDDHVRKIIDCGLEHISE